MKQLLTITLITATLIGCNNNPQSTEFDQQTPGASEETTVPGGDVKLVPLAAGNVWEYWYTSRDEIINFTPEGTNYSTTYTQGIHRYTLIARITDTLWQCERVFADSIFISGMDNQTTFLKDSILIDTIEISSGGENVSSEIQDLFTSSWMPDGIQVDQCPVHFENSDIAIGIRSYVSRLSGIYQLYTPSVGLAYLHSQWAWTSGSGETNATLLSFNGIPYDGAKLYDFAKKNECP